MFDSKRDNQHAHYKLGITKWKKVQQFSYLGNVLTEDRKVTLKSGGALELRIIPSKSKVMYYESGKSCHKSKKRFLKCCIIWVHLYRSKYITIFQQMVEESLNNRNVVLQEDAEDTKNRTCEQHQRFSENWNRMILIHESESDNWNFSGI